MRVLIATVTAGTGQLQAKHTRLGREQVRIPTGGFVRHLKQFKPEAVWCPYLLPLEIVGSLKARRRLHACETPRTRKGCGYNCLSVCIVTDFEAHVFWIEPSEDLYCVATEETQAGRVN